MGGYGSGSSYYLTRKTCVEDCAELDAQVVSWSCFEREQRRFGYGWIFYLFEGSVSRAGFLDPVSEGTTSRTVQLRSSENVYHLESTLTPLGGLRWWWLCPRCGKRRAWLYMPPRANFWACRVCHDLKYRSQRENYRLSKFDCMIWLSSGALASMREKGYIGRLPSFGTVCRSEARDEKRWERRNAWRRKKRKQQRRSKTS